jgi:hypothetical protein
MILTEVEPVAQENRRAEKRQKVEDDFCVCKGGFVGLVQRHDSQYEFVLRDLRRERPTIYGFGVDFPHAVTAVTQLLDALTHGV